MSTQLQLTVQFIVYFIPHKLKDEILVDDEARVVFIEKYMNDVPVKFAIAFKALIETGNELTRNFNDLLDGTLATREYDMRTKITKWKGQNSLNVAIMGAMHVVNLASYTEEKFIFMMPRLVLDTNPEMNLPLDKDEL